MIPPSPEALRPSSRRLQEAIAVGVCLALCVMALRSGLAATADLDWPAGQDFSRDMASARMIWEGQPFADPFYSGEGIWYNPLTPAIVAAVSRISGQPVHRTYARLGASLNLLAPIGFSVLCWVVSGPLAAMFGLAGFLIFVPDGHGAILCATYSPWLMTVHVAQIFFYAALVLFVHACRRPSRARFAVAGAALGIVFLAHTAPFLILCAVAGCELLTHRLQRRFFVTFFGTAAAVSAPLWGAIAWRYHFVVRNSAPMSWVTPELSYDGLGSLVAMDFFWSPTVWIVLTGTAILVGEAAQRPSRLVLCTAAVASAFLAYTYLIQYAGLHGVTLPPVVPAFHFSYYIGAMASVAFGAALSTATRTLARLVLPVRWQTVGVVAGSCLLVASVLVRLDRYHTRPDVTDERSSALTMFADPALRSMYEWIEQSTQVGDVFAAGDRLGLSVITPAGRKVVAVDRVFSNPYVDWSARNRDRNLILEHLMADDWAPLPDLLDRYHVKFVAVDFELPAAGSVAQHLQVAWRSGAWRIYRTLYQGPPGSDQPSSQLQGELVGRGVF